MKNIILSILFFVSLSANAQSVRQNQIGDAVARSLTIGSVNVATELQKRADSLYAHLLRANRFEDSVRVYRTIVAALTDSTKKIKPVGDSIVVHRAYLSALTDSVKILRGLVPAQITATQMLSSLNTLSSLVFTKPFTLNSATYSVIAYLSSVQFSVTSQLDMIDGANFRFHGTNNLLSDYGMLWRPSDSRNVVALKPTWRDSSGILVNQGYGTPKYKHITGSSSVSVTQADTTITINSRLTMGDAYLRSAGDSVSVSVSNIVYGVASWSTPSPHIGTLTVISRGSYFTIFSNGDENVDNLKVTYYIQQ